MKTNCIAAEHFGDLDKHYFIDFLEAKNLTDCIQITRSDRQKDGTYLRSSVRIFEENFAMLFEAFSMLLADVRHFREEDHHQRVLADAAVTVKGIKSWPLLSRPREKLLCKGKEALSDAELLAMLIGSGTREHSAVDLAAMVLDSVGGNLAALAKLSIADLCKFKGIGKAKALAIIAAVELAERRFVYRYQDQETSILR